MEKYFEHISPKYELEFCDGVTYIGNATVTFKKDIIFNDNDILELKKIYSNNWDEDFIFSTDDKNIQNHELVAEVLQIVLAENDGSWRLEEIYRDTPQNNVIAIFESE